MKYQITCDNCGTQFIVEAGEGQTIECKCPHCHGVMEVTLPLVSAGQQYEQQPAYAAQDSGNDDGKEKKNSLFLNHLPNLFCVFSLRMLIIA